MKISARNVLKGKVVSIKAGPVSTLVVIEVAKGVQLTSTITSSSAKELKLKKGKPAYAVIKSSSVIVGVD
jgi:molybdopterin-binding protein